MEGQFTNAEDTNRPHQATTMETGGSVQMTEQNVNGLGNIANSLRASNKNNPEVQYQVEKF